MREPVSPGEEIAGEPVVETIVTELAFVVFHESAVAEKSKKHTGTGGGVTLTPSLQVTVPPGPDAVRVYVLDVVGDTVVEPFAETPPIPWLIVTDVAFVVVHERVEEPPVVIAFGDACNVHVGAG